MKTCDICKKQTNHLEELPYCSVCSDCAVEVSDEGDPLISIFEEDDGYNCSSNK